MPPPRPPLKPVRWMGDSLKVLRDFPEEVQVDIGHSLMVVQAGLMPSDAKPMKGFGSGILELAIRFDGDAYRTVYAVQLGNYIYVLHVFQKKSKSGIKTTKQDIDLIAKRLKAAKDLEEEL
jgi:phage-related protein